MKQKVVPSGFLSMSFWIVRAAAAADRAGHEIPPIGFNILLHVNDPMQRRSS
jgi:hypothetical protein